MKTRQDYIEGQKVRGDWAKRFVLTLIYLTRHKLPRLGSIQRNVIRDVTSMGVVTTDRRVRSHGTGVDRMAAADPRWRRGGPIIYTCTGVCAGGGTSWLYSQAIGNHLHVGEADHTTRDIN